MSVVRALKEVVMRVGRRAGLLAQVRQSGWRRDRLLILCYHGVSVEDEHEWDPRLYVPQSFLRRRLQLLRDGGFPVLPLAEGVRRLREGTLPAGAICLTFDDGVADFRSRAHPVLADFGVPATVYQTTYYAAHAGPVFDTFASYLLWKGREWEGDLGALVPEAGVVSLRDPASRAQLHRRLLAHVHARGFSSGDKDALLDQLADRLGVDVAPLRQRRLMHLMNAEEIAALSRVGVDFQLHTHRHRTPADREPFLREIEDNRRWLETVTGKVATHFCYPSGVYRAEMLPWLVERGVETATTCDPGIATRQNDPLLLPRFVDTLHTSEDVFLAWASGFAELLPRRTRVAAGAHRHA